MERVVKMKAGLKWLIIGSVKVYLDAIKLMRFSNTVGNLSSSYVVGLFHSSSADSSHQLPARKWNPLCAMPCSANAVARKRQHSDAFALNMSLFHVLWPFIHFIVCLTTDLQLLPKWAFHIERSRVSSFRCEYPLPSLSLSTSFLRLLSHLPLTSVPLLPFPQ
jgi:hypothetical protein